MLLGHDLGEGSLNESGADVPREQLEVMPLGRREGKGLVNDHRAVREVPIGRHQRDLGSIAREVSQREQCFDSRYAAAENQDVA